MDHNFTFWASRCDCPPCSLPALPYPLHVLLALWLASVAAGVAITLALGERLLGWASRHLGKAWYGWVTTQLAQPVKAVDGGGSGDSCGAGGGFCCADRLAPHGIEKFRAPPCTEGTEVRQRRNDSDSVCTAPPPQHIAVIMDGNRRYGKAVHGDPMKGHAEGGKVLADFVGWCAEEGAAVLTVFAFSTENWRRDPREVDALMGTLCEYCRRFRDDARERNVRVRALVTSPEKLPESVREAVAEAEQATAACTGLTLNICLSYGGREELVGACRRIAEQVQCGTVHPSSIDEETLRAQLLTRHVGDPDVLIRTSGERRVSNFLLYQLAYTEMFFLDKHWPEVRREDLAAIVRQYQLRQRRFGQ